MPPVMGRQQGKNIALMLNACFAGFYAKLGKLRNPGGKRINISHDFFLIISEQSYHLFY